MNRQEKMGSRVAALACAALLALPGYASASKVRQALTPTSIDPDASGKALLVVSRPSKGKFEVKVKHLDADAAFEVLVGGTDVATIQTNGGGNGSVRFRSRPRGHDFLLGFDPRGQTVTIRNAAGNDVLTADVPSASVPVDQVVCCIPDDAGTDCEDRSSAECAAQGGTPLDGATSCLPNPCPGATPVGDPVVCCIPGYYTSQCEDRSQAECTAAGGTLVSATSCQPNPCAPTDSPDAHTACCIPDDSGAECEDRSPEACVAAGGTVSTATSCTPDPCSAVLPTDPTVACCVPTAGAEGQECEMETTSQCAALGGTVNAAPSCEPDPCGGTHGGHGGGN